MTTDLQQKINERTAKIGIIGLGYVGLPLAVEFGKKFDTIGFDINQKRIDELSSGTDHTLECSGEQLAEAKKLRFATLLKVEGCTLKGEKGSEALDAFAVESHVGALDSLGQGVA